MNYNLTTQLAAQHQAALAADGGYRAQFTDTRAARKANATPAQRPARNRRLFVGRPATAA